MDWLRQLWNVVARVVLPVVTAVQRVVQQVRTATAQQPDTPPEANAAARAAQEAAAAQTRQQQAQQQRAAQFDRDIGQHADSTPFPVITPAEKRAMRELLASPTNQALPLLVEPDADVVLKIARQVPGILETAVQLCGSFKGAFDYLLADGVSLAEEEITALLGQVGPAQVGHIDPCSAIPGWYRRRDGRCIFLGGENRPLRQEQIDAGQVDLARDLYDAVLTLEQRDLYLRWKDPSIYNENMRQLFLVPAQLLNDPALTNMSANALAMLIASQVFAEEKWHKGTMWIHPFYNRGDDPWTAANDVLRSESFLGLVVTGTVNDKRRIPGDLAAVASLNHPNFSTYEAFSYVLSLNNIFISRESEKPFLLQGLGYGLGNQTFPMAWAAALWFVNYAPHNAEAPRLDELPSDVFEWLGNEDLATVHLIAELGDYGVTPLDEVPDPKLGQKSSFWNAMRFLFAAAAQREGTSEPSGNFNYITLENLSETNLEGHPGRPIQDVSAFSLLTTVYSGSVTVPNFALYSMGTPVSGNEIHNPNQLADGNESSPLQQAIRERNKAIEVVERMVNEEGQYRIGQQMSIAPLTTKYNDPINGDFLPYSREEAELLVRALVYETPTPDPESLLCRATLLRQAYEFYFSATAWNALVGAGCGG